MPGMARSGRASAAGTGSPSWREAVSRSSRGAPCPATARTAGALHRGRRRRHPDRLPLPAERQPAARAQVRLQARLVRAPDRPRRLPRGQRPARGAGRRLQRRADRGRHLSDQVVGQGCAAAARQPRRLPALARSGLGRCGSRLPPGPRALHLLGLQARSLAARRRAEDRPPPAKPGAGGAPFRRRGRPRGPWPRRGERPRAGLGDPAGASRGARPQTAARHPALRSRGRTARVSRRRVGPLWSGRGARQHPGHGGVGPRSGARGRRHAAARQRPRQPLQRADALATQPLHLQRQPVRRLRSRQPRARAAAPLSGPADGR